MSQKTKITLKCAYGKHAPGANIEVDEKLADKLINIDKAATKYVGEVDVESEKVTALTTENTSLKDQVTALTTENKDLKAGDIGKLKQEIATLKGQKTKLENEVKSLKG